MAKNKFSVGEGKHSGPVKLPNPRKLKGNPTKGGKIAGKNKP